MSLCVFSFLLFFFSFFFLKKICFIGIEDLVDECENENEDIMGVIDCA